MTIGRRILLFFSVIVLLLSALAMLMWYRLSLQQQLTRAHQARYESYRLAAHLKNTADQLTRMARTYTVTGDSRYKEYYRHILAIRNGEEPRPKGYSSLLFWDRLTLDNDYAPAASGHPLSDLELLKRARIHPREIATLQKAQHYADQLIALEQKAFHLMELASIDDSLSNANRLAAQQLLHGARYHRIKARFSELLSRFFDQVEKRTYQHMQRVNRQSSLIDKVMMGVILLLLLLVLAAWHHTRKRIVRPLKELTGWTEALKAGRYNLPPLPYKGSDEIGRLARSFQTMARTIHDHVDDLNLKANTDPLTGLPNRLFLHQQMQSFMENMRLYGTPCVIILMDLDHFKSINDRYGHPVGDQVLIQFATLLRNTIKSPHVVGRWGGEEFMVLTQGITLFEAQELCENFRREVEVHRFAEGIQVTVSIGLAVVDHHREMNEAILRADEALYRAKANGRNRVELGARLEP